MPKTILGTDTRTVSAPQTLNEDADLELSAVATILYDNGAENPNITLYSDEVGNHYSKTHDTEGVHDGYWREEYEGLADIEVVNNAK